MLSGHLESTELFVTDAVRGVGDGDGGRERKGNFAKFSPPGVIEGGEAVTSGSTGRKVLEFNLV